MNAWKLVTEIMQRSIRKRAVFAGNAGRQQLTTGDKDDRERNRC